MYEIRKFKYYINNQVSSLKLDVTYIFFYYIVSFILIYNITINIIRLILTVFIFFC